MPGTQVGKAFAAWSEKVSNEGLPTDKTLPKQKAKPWKEFVSASKRTEPFSGPVFVSREGNEDIGEDSICGF